MACKSFRARVLIFKIKSTVSIGFEHAGTFKLKITITIDTNIGTETVMSRILSRKTNSYRAVLAKQMHCRHFVAQCSIFICRISTKDFNRGSMECSSMVSISTFGPGDPGSNPGWFTVSNSSQRLSFHE